MNTCGRVVNYQALARGEDPCSSGEEADSSSDYDTDDGESVQGQFCSADRGARSAAASGGVSMAAAQQQSAAAVPNREAVAALDDDELDRRLAAAEALREQLERDDARNRKIRRLLAIEEDNAERQRRAAVPRGRVPQPTSSGTARAPRGEPAAPHRQAEARPPRTMADLRGDRDVSRRAGRILADLGLFSDSETESEPSLPVWHSRGRRLRSSMDAKASDVVLNPQLWPHVALQLEFTGKSHTFAELDLRLLVARELEVLSGPSIDAVERAGRLELLKQVVYAEGNLGWGAAKSLYAAVLRKVE